MPRSRKPILYVEVDPLEKFLPLGEPLSKVFSESARIAALESRRAKATGGGFQHKLDMNGRADVNNMLSAIDSRRTNSGHHGHQPGEAFNPEKASKDEQSILQLHAEKLSTLEISRALGLDFKETRDKLIGWRVHPPLPKDH